MCYMSMGNLVSMSVYRFVHVSVYVFMCRHVYVYEYDCYVHILHLYVFYDCVAL